MDVTTHELPIDWPEPLQRSGGDGLRWGMSLAAALALFAGTRDEAPPLARLVLDEPFALQDIALVATLMFELDRLVRIELVGPLDGLALAALGVGHGYQPAGDGSATAGDVGHYRLRRGDTRIAIDMLDGLIALEPEGEM